VSAKECRRVRKSVKRKNLNTVVSDEWLLGMVRSELVPEWNFRYTPGSFRKWQAKEISRGNVTGMEVRQKGKLVGKSRGA